MAKNRFKAPEIFTTVLFVLLAAFWGGCKKDSTIDSGSLYTPTASNVTANATLQELQQGRTLYISHCGSCHGLYNPESYSSMQWKSIMNSMGPKTSMSASDLLLVTKYVCMGKQ
jgi:hypothetical protein